MIGRIWATLTLTAMITGGGADWAMARPAARGEGSVTVCSRYGNGCTTAPVRAGRMGLEMRLKGGTWVNCMGSCKDTLREETVDFWDTQREKHGGHR